MDSQNIAAAEVVDLPDADRRPRKTLTAGQLILLNIVAIALGLALLRLISSRIFDYQLPDVLSLQGIAALGAAGVVTTLVPKRTRSVALVRLRQFLSSRKGTVTCFGLLLLAACLSMLVRHDVYWQGPKVLGARYDGEPVELRAEQTTDGFHRTSFIEFAFVRHELAVDRLPIELRGYPLGVIRHDIPLFSSLGSDASPRQVEETLMRVLFQHFEGEQIDQASTALQVAAAEKSIGTPHLLRLTAILNVLRASYQPKHARTKQSLAVSFRERFPNDPWIPVLNAVVLLNDKQFEQCIAALSDRKIGDIALVAGDNLSASARFVKASCQLKRAMTPGLPGSRKTAMLASAGRNFAATHQVFAQQTSPGLADLAGPSAAVFKSISEFYAGNLDAALGDFVRAGKSGEPDLRARAYNGAGFVRLVQGRVEESKSWLNRALAIDPNFPLARSNFGFCLLAEGDYAAARQYFEANAKDEKLIRLSQRDVTLAKLSLAHLKDIASTSRPEVNEAYADVLASSGGNRWDGIGDPDVRYGYLANELTDRIYLNGQYFGLEMFALSYICRARIKLADRTAPDIKLELDAKAAKLHGMVQDSWIKQPRSGWFSSLQACAIP